MDYHEQDEMPLPAADMVSVPMRPVQVEVKTGDRISAVTFIAGHDMSAHEAADNLKAAVVEYVRLSMAAVVVPRELCEWLLLNCTCQAAAGRLIKLMEAADAAKGNDE